MKQKKWYIKEENYSHGDLYELIETTTFYVFREGLKKPVYTFKGDYYADLDGGIWVKSGATGVCDVKINNNEQTLTVIYYDKTQEIISLKK